MGVAYDDELWDVLAEIENDLKEHLYSANDREYRELEKKLERPKKKRRFKMSKEYSIPLLPLLIAGYFILGIGDDDEDVSETVEPKTDNKEIVEQVKQKADETVEKFKPVIEEAKKQFLEDEKDEPEKIVKKDSSDPYAQDSDRYGSTDDKW